MLPSPTKSHTSDPKAVRSRLCVKKCTKGKLKSKRANPHGTYGLGCPVQIRVEGMYPLVKKIFSTGFKGMIDAANHLQENGWAVVGPILEDTGFPCEKLLLKDIAAIPDFPTLTPELMPKYFPWGESGYLVRGNNLPNGSFAWSVRKNQTIRRFFALIHGVRDPSEMCTSMDGIFLASSGRSVKGLPLHYDAFPESEKTSFSPETLSVQGILNFTPAEDAEDSSTILIPGSHLQTLSFDRKMVPMELQATYRSSCIKPVVPKDHLLVFNSRTIHGSSPQLRDRPDRTCINRLAVPVQFMPKKRRSEATLRLKQMVYLKQTGSFAKPDDQFRIAKPSWHECRFAAKHGFPHKTCRIPARLENGKIPEDVLELL